MTAPRHKVCVVVSGTQGEPMSALSRVAVDNHKNLSVETGDTVVLSSRIIPGNEKAIGRMMNHMARRGADIIYGNMNPPVHVSGHASAEELKLVLNLVRPRYFIPIHGEYLQMAKHAQLAQHLLTAGLEETLRSRNRRDRRDRPAWAREWARRSRSAASASIPGSLTKLCEDMVIRDRRHLSEDGFVLPIIAINKHTGQMRRLCRKLCLAASFRWMTALVMQEARQVVARTLETSSAEERTDWGVMQEKIRADLRRYLNKQTQRRPLIMPVILEV